MAQSLLQMGGHHPGWKSPFIVRAVGELDGSSKSSGLPSGLVPGRRASEAEKRRRDLSAGDK